MEAFACVCVYVGVRSTITLSACVLFAAREMFRKWRFVGERRVEDLEHMSQRLYK